ncbi:MAG: tetratricopeptide repeat protein [Pseudanabaenaceae cyanobacterium bins.39]|nr:tetratricopeptide repeat protein [Pseudanabaenaceae cyanobacterium bins.39]
MQQHQNQPNYQNELETQLYLDGVSKFEGGNYQQAIDLLERAKALADSNTTLGGDIAIWLANSYDAAGKTEEAIAICRNLRSHPSGKIRKSARYILGILTAPQLGKLEGLVSEVPVIQSSDVYTPKPVAAAKGTGDRPPFREISLEPPITNSHNNFLWFALFTSLLGLVIFLSLSTYGAT